jgi:hypothetical protein
MSRSEEVGLTMSATTILHLTDLHFGMGSTPKDLAERKVALDGLFTALKGLPAAWKPGIVCLSGDIGWRGAATDYAEAKKWLKLLLARLDLTANDLFLCPGNHDIDRNLAIRHACPADSDAADQCLQTPVSLCPTAGAFAAYSAFCQDFGVQPYTIEKEESFLVGVVEHKGIRFVGCNSAWYCQGDDDKNKLWVGLPFLKALEACGQLPPTASSETVPTVCLIHHPPDWWHDGETQAGTGRPNTQDYLAYRCHIILSGHTHGEVRQADRIAQSAHHFTGGASFAGASHFNSFRLIRIAENELVYRSFEFDPRSADCVWQDRWGEKSLELGNRRSARAGKKSKKAPKKSKASNGLLPSLADAIATYKRKIDVAWRGGVGPDGKPLLGADGKPLGTWVEMETHEDFKDASNKPS